MPRAKTDETQLLDSLTRLFRDQGFAAASLTRIAEATGLQRASLYHRFPGGKAEMALAVLRRVNQRFTDEILAPLRGAGAPATRIRNAARKLDEFYEGGERSCLIDTLSLGDPTREIRDAIAASIGACTDAFAAVARDAGHGAAAARQLAQDALLRLEGSLVVARATGDTQAFKRCIKDLPRLLGPSP